MTSGKSSKGYLKTLCGWSMTRILYMDVIVQFKESANTFNSMKCHRALGK